MQQVSITQISNAFIPAREISDAEKFAGRKEYVQEAYYALNTNGANIAIVGGRGIGKSSLARQIINLGQGNNSILEKLEIYNDNKLDFLSIYFACGNNIITVNDLLERLLTTRDCLLEWIYEIPAAQKELSKLTGGIDVVVVKAGTDVSEEVQTKSIIQEHKIDVIFQNVISDIIKANISKNGILIVIDEFDQIKDPSGFASLLKSLATNSPSLKFCIVGVASDIQILMKEHQSADRLFAGSVINLPPMNEDEMNEIINNAENSIDKLITFDTSARKKMVSLANGHPYIIHLIGKQALKSAYLEPTYEINENYIELTLKAIAFKMMEKF